MHRLIALPAVGGDAFVDALRKAWDDGDAVLPLDPRLPRAVVAKLKIAMGAGAAVEDGDALVLTTSGTTGQPKGVVLTHAAVRSSALATSAHLGVDPAADRWLACLPLAHVGGLAVVTRALVTGTALEVLTGPFSATAVEEAARRGATLVALVATALRRVDSALFRTVVLGGGAPPPALPANVVTTYGMTETGSGIVYDGEPLEGVEVRAVDGELQVKGPMLLRCYRDGTDPKAADGWLATGDAGSIDKGGVVAVSGRLGDVIVTGGEKVWPEPVEAVLRECAGVKEVAVAGRHDPEWGERVVAFVVPTDPSDPPHLATLRHSVKVRLAPWAAPKELVLVDHLPRTALGKIRRRDLARSGQ